MSTAEQRDLDPQSVFAHRLHLEATSSTPRLTNLEDAEKFVSGGIFFVGTATCIIKWADLTLMTDPNFLHQGCLFEHW